MMKVVKLIPEVLADFVDFKVLPAVTFCFWGTDVALFFALLCGEGLSITGLDEGKSPDGEGDEPWRRSS